MNIIRGAITIEEDTPEEIKLKTSTLLNALKQANYLTEENTKAIVFSLTQDIHSYYPAKAARECGFSKPALFSCVEPQIEGSLPLCIRVMIFSEGDSVVQPVYLGKAANLRKDISSIMNIALDGPAGSGKSTIAKELAKSFNILYLDTGAMYRACALYLSECGVDLDDEKAVNSQIKNIDLSIDYQNGEQHTYVSGIDVSVDIRKNEISMLASKVARYSLVREKMVQKQQAVAAERSCVLDGRDIGSKVLPNTPFKFFVTASPKVRAERRYLQLQQKGTVTVTLEQLQAEIEARDKQDATRANSPLIQTKDAVLIDTTTMTIEQAVGYIKDKIQEKV